MPTQFCTVPHWRGVGEREGRQANQVMHEVRDVGWRCHVSHPSPTWLTSPSRRSAGTVWAQDGAQACVTGTTRGMREVKLSASGELGKGGLWRPVRCAGMTGEAAYRITGGSCTHRRPTHSPSASSAAGERARTVATACRWTSGACPWVRSAHTKHEARLDGSLALRHRRCAHTPRVSRTSAHLRTDEAQTHGANTELLGMPRPLGTQSVRIPALRLLGTPLVGTGGPATGLCGRVTGVGGGGGAPPTKAQQRPMTRQQGTLGETQLTAHNPSPGPWQACTYPGRIHGLGWAFGDSLASRFASRPS